EKTSVPVPSRVASATSAPSHDRRYSTPEVDKVDTCTRAGARCCKPQLDEVDTILRARERANRRGSTARKSGRKHPKRIPTLQALGAAFARKLTPRRRQDRRAPKKNPGARSLPGSGS